MSKTLIRYEQIRKADLLDDQKTAGQIANSESTSVTQEDLQEAFLSQIKRIIFGDNPGNWNDDFITGGISSLADIGSTSSNVHKSLRHLIHFLDEGPGDGFTSTVTKEVDLLYNVFPTEIRWKDNADRLIVKKTITRTGSGTVIKPNPIIWRVYDTDGTTVLATATDTITYTGVIESGRTRVFT